MQFASVQKFLRISSLVTALSQRELCSCHSFFVTKTRESRHQINFQPLRNLSQDWNFDVDEVIKDEMFEEFSDRMFRFPKLIHNVLVIQPFLRDNGTLQSNVDGNPRITTPELQLDEAVALTQTLPGWKVIDTCILGVHSYRRETFFGPGQIEKLKDIIKNSQTNSKTISAVFVSTNILRVRQIIALEEIFNVPIFDRYTIVIQIFRQHAVTSESKIQVAMAEIPYLRQCVKGFPKGLSDRLDSGAIIGGTGSVFVETRRELLNSREQKLKKALGLLRRHRERLRKNPNQISYPVVAVVGYTNAGKTSLIKALTGADKLKPRNKLFATLDVTKHEGTLPSNLKVLFVDTVGFITNIPTGLLESFTATLEDAIYSDVIVHVWDASNPDFKNQREHVITTLKNLNFGEEVSKKIVVVANKVDKIPEDDLMKLQKAEPDMFFVSTKTGYGMENMVYCLQNSVIKATGRFRMKIRVKTGGREYDWICREFAVEERIVENNSEFTLFTVITTKAQVNMFKHEFLKQ